MSVSKTISMCFGIVAAQLLPGAAMASPGCRPPEIGTDEAPMVSPPLGAVVIGAGRLPFFSAPSPQCAIPGVFVIPKDELIVYAQTASGWSSVVYMSQAGNDVSGWVRSNRLKTTGTMGPSQ